MGQLLDGHPLVWHDTVDVRAYVRRHGVVQFVHQFKTYEHVDNACWTWGDELEFILVDFDHENKRVRLLLNGKEVLEQLTAAEHVRDGPRHATWHPEYAAYMVEGTPGAPYTGDNSSFDRIERSMRRRRELIQRALGPNQAVVSFAVFPMAGVLGHISSDDPVAGPVARSRYFPDAVICRNHPRFATLTRNIRERRGDNVEIVVPMFRDRNTQPRVAIPDEPKFASLPDYSIHMDAMAFGMGCCCLQVTFQVANVSVARFLYDQFAVLAPVFMALTAASPFFRGYLADTDCRWDVISASVDDRTPGERGVAPLQEGEQRVSTSRYSPVFLYIDDNDAVDQAAHNDVPVEVDEEALQRLRASGMDDIMARHVAHLFVRDPLVIYNEAVYLDDRHTTAHFENIQSTNWNSARFKLPPAEGGVSWRVEFRSMEISITDFENAAFTTFIAILARYIMLHKLVFYMPMSQVQENMRRAHTRDSVNTAKFFMRDVVRSLCEKCDLSSGSSEMTIDEIVNGREGGFAGLLSFAYKYLEETQFAPETEAHVRNYLAFISARAAGRLPTAATFLRSFIEKHPSYAHDSRVPPDAAYDLTQRVLNMSNGHDVSELLGDFWTNRLAYEDENSVDYGDSSCRPVFKSSTSQPASPSDCRCSS